MLFSISGYTIYIPINTVGEFPFLHSLSICFVYIFFDDDQGASQMVLVVKNVPASAEDVRDMGLISGSERSPWGGHGDPLQ